MTRDSVTCLQHDRTSSLKLGQVYSALVPWVGRASVCLPRKQPSRLGKVMVSFDRSSAWQRDTCILVRCLIFSVRGIPTLEDQTAPSTASHFNLVYLNILSTAKWILHDSVTAWHYCPLMWGSHLMDSLFICRHGGGRWVTAWHLGKPHNRHQASYLRPCTRSMA